MKAIVGLILVLLTGSLAVPVNNKDDSLDNYIKAVLELFRAQMPTGIPSLGIPVLDPFQVPDFSIPHISTSGVEADISIDDFVITYLATFETRNVHIDITALSLNLELFLPKLRGDAVYKLDGSIFSILPLFGDGPLFTELTELRISVNGGIKINADGYIQVTGLDLDLDFASILLHLDNLLGGGDFGETINNLLSALGPVIWDAIQGNVFDLVNQALTDVINDALGKCSIAQIIDGTCSPIFK